MGASHLDYLYSLDRLGIKPGLERMEVIMEALNHPEKQFKSIHIAGTNGKGSVAAMIESVLRASGGKTALYTSPDIYSYHERTKSNGQAISDEDLADLTWELKKVCEDIGLQLTFFEFGTALAYLYFARQQVDVAVIEVGMGGLLDATNVITPILSVITNIALDHQEFLGETKAEIAREKAGIIKPNVQVVTGEEDTVILRILKDTARAVDAPLTQVAETITADVVERSWQGQRVRIEFLDYPVEPGNDRKKFELFLPLLGDYQIENLKTALVALAIIFPRVARRWAAHPEGIPEVPASADVGRPELDAGVGGSAVTGPAAWEAVKSGIASTKWEGRLDVVSEQPLIIVDGAHNADGMNALADFLESVPRRDVLVFGLKQGKTIDAAVQRLISLFDHAIVAEGNYQPQSAVELKENIALYHPSVIAAEHIAEAMTQAQAVAGGDGTIVVAGSLYLIADALGILRGRIITHQPTETTTQV